MTITKLASGNYRVRYSFDGKRVSLTFDHVPTEVEVERTLRDRIRNGSVATSDAPNRSSLQSLVNSYIELKTPRNSVATMREYEHLCNHFSKEFIAKPICEVNQIDVDREILSWIKKNLAYKTMFNYISMFLTIVHYYTEQDYNLNMLPEKPKKEDIYIPTHEDVKRIMAYMKEHYPTMYVPYWLSGFGLRRGEVLALGIEDIDFETNTINITKDMVQDKNKKWVVKPPKTQVSIRSIPVSKDLTDYIKQQGYIYQGHPNSINKALKRCQDKLGIERFSLHKMRHYTCTELFQMGINEKDVCAYMGWASRSKVIHEVYEHSRLIKDKEKMKTIAEKLSATWAETS